ncbi:hypothetical protein PGTUg99_015570 [Puccinia graminis f. sp. tritici]|uniref:Uncharacterized protein n=2 Tax=Puccinia graminis f. sp. tritici TaxID=56615 RepID=E3L4Z4_PUCGT|nr:uncharacterized protein PGTG_17673 [Puccinia graminis f. sp. tritici CRL 75-36-700-3]EFP91619.1 hypothetical protein PGTG_17673 [Puccinia graminis f. sp. tritici CRL 75-36-700-3]KAA1125373.1 hypothetical protein PGTUg99_015570 [Puccinia graminis f. sp. tritici]
MLSNRPATPFPASPILGEDKKELNTQDNIHNTPPSKLRLPSRLPSFSSPRGASFRSISERRSGERPTFELSCGPVPAIFRNKRIDMNRLKNIDLDKAFGPSKRRSVSGTNHQGLGLAERGAGMMSGSRLQQSELIHKRLSCSVNGR